MAGVPGSSSLYGAHASPAFGVRGMARQGGVAGLSLATVNRSGFYPSWGPSALDPADFNVDDEVGIVDFLQLLANWGTCP